MPDAKPTSQAQAIYPEGPSTLLGNEDPEKVLSEIQGEHLNGLAFGEDRHRDAYRKLYGDTQTLQDLEDLLQRNRSAKGQKTGGGAWYDELEQYYNRVLSEQGT